MQAIEAANTGDAVSYGGDKATHDLEVAFSNYFETPVCAFPVGTGTAANALALAIATPRFGAIYCHQYAHIETTDAAHRSSGPVEVSSCCCRAITAE